MNRLPQCTHILTAFKGHDMLFNIYILTFNLWFGSGWSLYSLTSLHIWTWKERGHIFRWLWWTNRRTCENWAVSCYAQTPQKGKWKNDTTALVVTEWSPFPRLIGKGLSTDHACLWSSIAMSTWGHEDQVRTRCQIWGTLDLHRDPLSKVLSEW